MLSKSPKRRMVCGRIAIALVAIFGGCMKGPGFLTQHGASGTSTEGATEKVAVATREENGAATASLSATSDQTQVVSAAANSTISGSAVEFPPGSLAIDLDVTIAAGETVATTALADELGLDVGFAKTAPAVTITAGSAVDAAQPFVLVIPMPDAASLQSADDPFAALAVIYRVQKIAADQAAIGLITRASLAVVNGYVRFETRHFGTFQAVLTTEPVEAPLEAVAAAEPEPPAPEPTPEPEPEPEPPSPARAIRFVSGMSVLNYADGIVPDDGLTAWLPRYTPSRVGSTTILTTDVITRFK